LPFLRGAAVLAKCISDRLGDDAVPQCGSAVRRKILSEKPSAVEPGRTYLVYGVALLELVIYVVVDTGLNVLTLAPMRLFEILDGRVSRYWTVSLKPGSDDLFVAPPPFHRPHFLEDFADGEPQAVQEVLRFRSLMEREWNSKD